MSYTQLLGKLVLFLAFSILVLSAGCGGGGGGGNGGSNPVELEEAAYDATGEWDLNATLTSSNGIEGDLSAEFSAYLNIQQAGNDVDVVIAIDGQEPEDISGQVSGRTYTFKVSDRDDNNFEYTDTITIRLSSANYGTGTLVRDYGDGDGFTYSFVITRVNGGGGGGTGGEDELIITGSWAYQADLVSNDETVDAPAQFSGTVEFMSSGNSVTMIWDGDTDYPYYGTKAGNLYSFVDSYMEDEWMVTETYELTQLSSTGMEGTFRKEWDDGAWAEYALTFTKD